MDEWVETEPWRYDRETEDSSRTLELILGNISGIRTETLSDFSFSQTDRIETNGETFVRIARAHGKQPHGGPVFKEYIIYRDHPDSQTFDCELEVLANGKARLELGSEQVTIQYLQGNAVSARIAKDGLFSRPEPIAQQHSSDDLGDDIRTIIDVLALGTAGEEMLGLNKPTLIWRAYHSIVRTRAENPEELEEKLAETIKRELSSITAYRALSGSERTNFENAVTPMIRNTFDRIYTHVLEGKMELEAAYTQAFLQGIWSIARWYFFNLKGDSQLLEMDLESSEVFLEEPDGKRAETLGTKDLRGFNYDGKHYTINIQGPKVSIKVANFAGKSVEAAAPMTLAPDALKSANAAEWTRAFAEFYGQVSATGLR